MSSKLKKNPTASAVEIEKLFNSCVCSGARVLFALGEVRMHARSALHCLTVVFSRCHRLAVVMVLCALGPS